MVGGVSPSSFPIKISMKIEKILKNIPSARPQRMLGTCRYVSVLAGGGGSAIPSRSFGEQRDGREGVSVEMGVEMARIRVRGVPNEPSRSFGEREGR